MRLSLIISALVACCAATRLGQRRGVRRDNLPFEGKSRSFSTVEKRDAAVYRPLNVIRSRETAGIHARDTTDLSSLNPSGRAHLVFGRLGEGEGELQLADMTLYADNNLPIVMMEAFEGLTSDVDCNGDDGEMSLTFTSAEALNHAIDSWSYINEDADREFIMITNHDGCGPEGQRQGYKITDVDNDEDNNVVWLAASRVPWSEFAGSFDMEFGKLAVSPSVRRSLQSRGVFDWIDDVVDGIKGIGDGDVSDSVTIPVSLGEEGVEKLIFEDFTTLPPRLTLFCSNCFAEGKFETTGTLKVENFLPETLLLEVSPQDFRSAIELKAQIAGTSSVLDFLTWEIPIVELAIPGAGIVIPGIFTLGAKAAFKIKGSAGVVGTATFSFGGKTTLPNGSKVTIDVINPDNSGTTGFDRVDFEPVLDFDGASITANIAAGPQQTLTFGIDILGSTGFEAGLTFGTPTFNLNVTTGYDENGFCSPEDPITSGIKTVSAANVDLILQVIGEIADRETSLFAKKLVNIPIATFLDECLSIDGITPPQPNDDQIPTALKGPAIQAPPLSGTVVSVPRSETVKSAKFKSVRRGSLNE
ncbi:hypothetical protein AJ80_05273 [Polytolypa hystricis UAMH7299]|uniref:Peptidase A1 domain-containing protein n=1 Tax=Polytolypa hystricis (strain UAMH7299) TaxID=1447883 RepID=A0A2B7Y4T7_POLH7|nr:hypothetical protein AJ80_05273 [Polytolypa hystricis UAMH7299]